MTIDIGTCIATDFAAYVGSEFCYEHPQGRVDFRLHRVQDTLDFKPATVWMKRPPFSLFFLAPVGMEVGQGTFTLRHGDLGVMMVFMTPIGRLDGKNFDLTQPLVMQCSFS